MLVLLWDCTSCTRESEKKQWRQGSGKYKQQFQRPRVLNWQGKKTLSNRHLRANLSMSCSVTLISCVYTFSKLAIDVSCYQAAMILGASCTWCNVTEVFLCVILYPFIWWYSLFIKCIQDPPCLKHFMISIEPVMNGMWGSAVTSLLFV